MAISDYSPDPNNNGSISGIDTSEGCASSGINNAIRQLMADIAGLPLDEQTAITAFSKTLLDNNDLETWQTDLQITPVADLLALNNNWTGANYFHSSLRAYGSQINTEYTAISANSIALGYGTTGDVTTALQMYNSSGGVGAQLYRAAGANGYLGLYQYGTGEINFYGGAAGSTYLMGVNTSGLYLGAGARVAEFSTDTALGTSITKVPVQNAVKTYVDSKANATHTGEVTGATALTITNGAVTNAKLGADAVDGTKIANDAIGAEHIKASAVGASEIASGAVGNSELATGAVTAVKIASSTITATQLAADSVGASEIAASAVGNSELAANAVTADKIAANAVGASEIAANAVGSSEIADNAVGLAQMAHGTDGNLITYNSAGAPAHVATGSSGQVLTSNGAGAAPTMQTPQAPDYIRIADVRSQGTNGGTNTIGSWTKRTLNTEDVDAGGHAALSSSVITLQAGTYRVAASAPFYGTNWVILRLRNTSDSSNAVVGPVVVSSGNYPSTIAAQLQGEFTIASSKNFELQYHSHFTAANIGTGYAYNISGISERYAEIHFWKIG